MSDVATALQYSHHQWMNGKQFTLYRVSWLHVTFFSNLFPRLRSQYPKVTTGPSTHINGTAYLICISSLWQEDQAFDSTSEVKWLILIGLIICMKDEVMQCLANHTATLPDEIVTRKEACQAGFASWFALWIYIEIQINSACIENDGTNYFASLSLYTHTQS